jgi:hypothetical protein
MKIGHVSRTKVNNLQLSQVYVATGKTGLRYIVSVQRQNVFSTSNLDVYEDVLIYFMSIFPFPFSCLFQ